MPTLQTIKRQPKGQELELLLRLYETSFPPEERRPSEQIFATPPEGLELYLIYSTGAISANLSGTKGTDALLGFVTLWHLGSFIFIEHFALRPEFRGQGYGSALVRLLLGQYAPLPLVLECELPDYSPDAQRRIAFYRALGFEALPIDYVQPPYLVGGSSVPMLLLSTKHELSPLVVETIHRQVYGIEPLPEEIKT